MNKIIETIKNLFNFNPLVGDFIRTETDMEFSAPDCSDEIYFRSEAGDSGKIQTYTLRVTPGETHPIALWVYWCSNYPLPAHWIPEVWPGEVMCNHMLTKWNAVIRAYNPDEAMNMFFRALSKDNQAKLIDYIIKNYSNTL